MIYKIKKKIAFFEASKADFSLNVSTKLITTPKGSAAISDWVVLR